MGLAVILGGRMATWRRDPQLSLVDDDFDPVPVAPCGCFIGHCDCDPAGVAA